MGLKLNYHEGQTPLNEEEKDGLLIQSITNHLELDEFEQLNIEKAIEWLVNTKLSKDSILTEKFILLLHKKMFEKVWAWAGQFRKSEKNIGVKWVTIREELKKLLDDTNFWLINKSYSSDEIAIRFKHRLVSIHCFSNGNGRHSRIMADIIIENIFGENLFNWNDSDLTKPSDIRKEYIQSIREADNGNIINLINFARN